jgi:hypothetical protein
MKNIIYVFLILSVVFTSCENQEWEFPDFKYQSVYFAHQYPVRTITLGDDIFDTSLDNQGKCEIRATTGGVYKNEKAITIGIEVNNELCNGLTFTPGGADVIAMPSEFYTLAANNIVIPKGQLTGGVEIQLTDAFFADPMALKNTYVIPVVMTSLANADSILSGVGISSTAVRTTPGDWVVRPKDYVLYAVKYINPWHGFYLRRGKDVITGDVDTTILRHKKYVEWDEVNSLKTSSMSQVEFPLVYKSSTGANVNCTLLLNIDKTSGNITVSSGTAGATASGTGKFVTKGEKKAWGDKDRDAIYLNYQIDLGTMNITATDTLVMRNRGVAVELFDPITK